MVLYSQHLRYFICLISQDSAHGIRLFSLVFYLYADNFSFYQEENNFRHEKIRCRFCDYRQFGRCDNQYIEYKNFLRRQKRTEQIQTGHGRRRRKAKESVVFWKSAKCFAGLADGCFADSSFISEYSFLVHRENNYWNFCFDPNVHDGPFRYFMEFGPLAYQGGGSLVRHERSD